MRDPRPVREPRYLVDIEAHETRASLFTGGRVRNISRGGLFVETPQPLPVASRLDLALRLDETGAVLKVKGRVVWTFDMRTHPQLMSGSGVRFLEMSGDQFELLETYLARLVSADSDPCLQASA